MRLKSIKNIEKITNTMKIVASTKMTKAQRAMKSSRVFKETDVELMKNAEPEPKEGKTLLVVVSSDKGLCGLIHSQVSKAAKRRAAELQGNVDIVAVGDKVKVQLLRSHQELLKLAFNGVGKEEPTFHESALIADEIAKLGHYDKIEVLFNRFVSGVSFEPSTFPAFSAAAIGEAPGLSKYELETENPGETLAQFNLANAIFVAQAEGHASEISARRNAMDNASKNAGDMINSYSILYNRTRQAVITNELVDIITGASSLD